jgi:TolB-like protein
VFKGEAEIGKDRPPRLQAFLARARVIQSPRRAAGPLKGAALRDPDEGDAAVIRATRAAILQTTQPFSKKLRRDASMYGSDESERLDTALFTRCCPLGHPPRARLWQIGYRPTDPARRSRARNRAEGMTACEEPDVSLVRAHLEKLRSSAAFVRSSNLFAFLVYVVEETLAGRRQTLKELVIGDALYSGAGPYDPGIDSTVRVEARRLRRKLADYYAREGHADRIRIELPTGSYRPVITVTAAGAPAFGAPAGSSHGGADLAVMPFMAISSRTGDGELADGLTDELIFALCLRSQLRLAPRLMTFQFRNRAFALAEAAERLGVAAMLNGTFRVCGERARVTVELSNPQGFIIWSAQVEEDCEDPILLQERLVDAIIARMPPWVVRPSNARLVLRSVN